jgi:hypothetical protein
MRVAIVGKGPTYQYWKKVKADHFLCLNHTIEKVRQGTLVQRDHGIVFDVPADCQILGPRAVIDGYGRGIYYNWKEIPKTCTACTAVIYADMLGATEILLIGFDNLMGCAVYHSDYPQSGDTRQWKWGLEQQIDQFRKLDADLRRRCILQPQGVNLDESLRNLP